MAAYPASIISFTTKQNVVNVVDASHPNSLQDEVRAIEIELGTNPRISTALATTYTDLKSRLEFIETYYRQISNHDSHASLGGLAGDDHLQYIKVDGTRAFTGLAAVAAAPGPVQAGDTQAAGSALTLARSDHRHAASVAAAGTSAVGDAAAAGAATTFARSDHVHGREAFGAVTTELNFGQAQSNGVATTLARSDHTHGTAALASTAPVNQAMGDAAAIGSGTTAAKADHKHGMPAFSSTVSDETTFSIAPNAGSASTVSRGDHTHGSTPSSLTGPSGVIAMWPTGTPPAGWLLCDGSAVSRTTYATLFGIIASTFGSGDGSTTFNLPDYRGRVPIGAGTGTGGGASGTGKPTGGSALTARVVAGWAGEETHVLTTAELASHSHTVNGHTHSGSTVASGGPSAHQHDYNHGHTVNDPQHNHNLGNRSPSTVTDGTGGILVSRGDSTSTVVDYNRGSANGRDLVTYAEIFSSGTGLTVNGTGATNTGSEGSSLAHSHSVTVASDAPGTNTQGSGTAHNVMQPTLGIQFIIKT